MSRLVVVVDMRANNNRAIAIIDARLEGMEWMADFASMQEVMALKEKHPFGRFPWVVLDLDNPQANSVLR